jgi:DNA-binding CsgD family transcriptional regulator
VCRRCACTSLDALVAGPHRDHSRPAPQLPLRESWQTPLIPLIESVMNEGLERARQVLDPAMYAAAWAEGQAMSLDKSLAAALALKVASTEQVNPGGLSATEARVLRLLARGRTTKEIAAELVIATSTADRHITHIYDKLGVRNRAQRHSHSRCTRTLSEPWCDPCGRALLSLQCSNGSQTSSWSWSRTAPPTGSTPAARPSASTGVTRSAPARRSRAGLLALTCCSPAPSTTIQRMVRPSCTSRSR